MNKYFYSKKFKLPHSKYIAQKIAQVVSDYKFIVLIYYPFVGCNNSQERRNYGN